MSGILACNEVCQDGRVLITDPYCPNPSITTYKRIQVPWKNINSCPTVVSPCHPWWLFRAHGFDLFFDSVDDIPPVNDLQEYEFPGLAATLVKVEVSWYEYGTSNRQAKGSSLMTGGPISKKPGRWDGRPLTNTGGAVFNKIVCDIGNGVNINIPPTGRILAELLVPDLDAFIGPDDQNPLNELAPSLPSEKIGVTRVVPSGFLTEFPFGYPSAKYTQSVYVSATQTTQTIPMPPLVKSISAYRADVAGGGAPIVDILFREDSPLNIPIAQHILAQNGDPLCGCPVPENAGAIRVTTGGYTGIVTIVLELDL